ncbi:MAG: DUF4352 domain-containing protein [bacterium]|nr:DUF4352 domain-containing protein [bacterium]
MHAFYKKDILRFIYVYIIFLFAIFLINLLFISYKAFAYVEANLTYDNNSYKAYIFNNISYVDTQVLASILDSPVYWDPNEKALIVSNLRVYTKAVVYKNKLLIALRDVLVPLGYQIKWDQLNRIITIYKPTYKSNTSKANLKIENNEIENKDINNNKNDNNKNTDKKDTKKYEIPFIDNNDNGDSKNINKLPVSTPPTVFIPRSASNEEFKITVSELKEVKLIKGLYTPQPGFKFIVLTVSQQNLSNKVQLYTGKFVLYDDKGYKYDYIEGLSSYILQVLLPSGMNFGTLVFEIPENNIPSKLVLETYGSTPITLSLI